MSSNKIESRGSSLTSDPGSLRSITKISAPGGLRPDGSKGKKSSEIRKAERALKQYIPEVEKYFSSSKATRDYTLRITNSIERYKRLERDNLCGIVMPAGTGKTTLASRYGCIDIDMLCSEGEHLELSKERARLVINANADWSEHNTKWHQMINKTLDMLDYTEPQVLLGHSEETLSECGAVILGTIVPDDKTFELNIRNRDPLQAALSRQNRKLVLELSRLSEPIVCRSNAEIEATFLEMLSVNGIAVACPRNTFLI